MNKRVTVAFAFGCALLLASYTFSPRAAAPAPAVDSTIGVVAATAPVRQYIPSTDTNNDGIPDWQESLLAADPLSITTATTYEAPDTLTDEFAITFFEAMVRNEQSGELGETPEEFALKAATALSNEVVLPSYTLEDINPTSDNSLSALATYSQRMSQIEEDATPDSQFRNELEIVNDALEKSEPAILLELNPIRESYEEMLVGILAVPVPSSLSQDHLVLVTTVSTILEHIKAMELALTDPIVSLMHIQQYGQSVQALADIIEIMAAKLSVAGVTYAPKMEDDRGMIRHIV